MMNRITVLGLSGGGSRTRAVILNDRGDTLGEGEGGPANIRAVDTATARTSLADAVQQALKSAHISPQQLSAATWALAGAGRAAEKSTYQSIANLLLPSIQTTITTDAEAALIGALGDRCGLVIIAGTGMIAYGEDGQGNAARAGGWGNYLDEGSGYALGIATLRSILAEADGTGNATHLTQSVLTHLNRVKSSKLISWLYDPERSPADVAALAPFALSAAESGDRVAVALVSKAADALADAAVAVYRRLQHQSETLPISYSGGLIEKSVFYCQLVQQAIRTRLPHMNLHPPQAEPVMGAAALAFAELGVSFIQPIETSLKEDSVWTSEQRNLLTMDLDLRSTLEIVATMHLADQQAVAAVQSQLPTIAGVIDQVVPRMQQGGRLIYVGAGTSGRLGVLDASECPPTFSASPDQVLGLVAGGLSALTRSSQEGAEDDAGGGAQAISDLSISPNDTVVGIAASGRTPYVVGALEAARQAKALTVALTCNLPAPIAKCAQYTIAPLVGPEVVTGSTRLKAGTAQKLVLNMLSTGTMVRLGKTYENLMVDLQQSTQKLKARAQRIVGQACSISAEEAAALLDQAQGDVKTAIAMKLLECSAERARRRLTEVGGVIRRLIKDT